MENGNMIRKNNKNIMEWIYENILDFTAENDTSGLNWDSTPEDVRKFLSPVSRKERVQKYGIFASRLHYYATIEFDDIEDGIKKGYLSEHTCSLICYWNKCGGHENWNMDDVRAVINY